MKKCRRRGFCAVFAPLRKVFPEGGIRMMNRKERVMAVLEGRAPQGTADSHLRFFRGSGTDLLKMMCAGFFVCPLGDAKTPADFPALRPMGMMLPLQGAEQGRFTREEYARLIAPTEKRVIGCSRAHSAYSLLHLCGWDGVPPPWRGGIMIPRGW